MNATMSIQTTFENQTQPSDQTVRRKVFLETWGCQMNVADSEQMLALLHKQNYVLTNNQEDADLFLLNTCHIREKSTHKVLSRLGELKKLKSEKDGRKIIVAGCVAQAEGARLMKKAPQIDYILGPGRIDELPAMLQQNSEDLSARIVTGFPNKDYQNPLTRGDHHEHTEAPTEIPTIHDRTEISRFINIQHGCNNFCTFCVVPFTRGREISKLPDEIVKEVEALVRGGAREITLLGQNVNSYGSDLVEKNLLSADDGGPFVSLLSRVAQIPELKRLRFTTSNPHDFSTELATLFKSQPKLGSYIHLPVQSGNNEVLDRMRRKLTREEYLERVQWLRAIDPEMSISTDLIVGFPGETDEQFADTLDLVERCQFSFIYSFKYSPRKNTAAARFLDQVPEEVKDRRLQALNQLQDKITVAQHQAELNRRRSVLFHYESRKEPGVYYGRTQQFRLVRVRAGRDLVGHELDVMITDGNKTALVGELIY